MSPAKNERVYSTDRMNLMNLDETVAPGFAASALGSSTLLESTSLNPVVSHVRCALGEAGGTNEGKRV